MLDPHTIYLIGFVSQAVFALTLALLALSDRRTRGTGWFAAGCCLELLMTSSRSLLRSERDMIAVSCGSCLLILVFFFNYMGMRWFSVRRPLKSMLGPVLTTISMSFVLIVSLYSVNAGLLAARLIAIVIMTLTIPMLWRTRILPLRAMARVASILVGLLLATLLGRLLVESAPAGSPSAALEFAGRLTTMLVASALSFSYVGLFVAESQRRLHDETRVDVLTGLRNRRSMDEVVSRLVRRASQAGSPLSLLVLDVDLFKNLNDTWGHAVGDRALQALGQILQSHRAQDEYVARLGGEEFAVLLPNARMEEAAEFAEKIRAAVEDLRIADVDSFANFTVSIGVSSLRAGERGWLDMMRRADKALYRAKNDGRNRVSSWCESDGIRGSQPDSKILHWRRPRTEVRSDARADILPDPVATKRAEPAH